MGRQIFTTGHLVTADELNSIASQTVQLFADDAARTAAYSSDTPATGELSMLADTRTLQVYDGTAWTDLMPRTRRQRPAFTFGAIPPRRSVSQTPDQVLTVADIAAGDYSNDPDFAIVASTGLASYFGLTSHDGQLYGVQHATVRTFRLVTVDVRTGSATSIARLTLNGTDY